MPRLTVDDPNDQTAPQFEELPEGGIFNATLTSIDERRHQRRDGTGEIVFLDWNFIIVSDQGGDDHFAGRKVRGSTLGALKTRGGELDTRAYRWSSNILEGDLPPGGDFDTDDLVGLTVQIEIGFEPDRKDPTRRWARAVNVMSTSGHGANPWGAGDPPF